MASNATEGRGPTGYQLPCQEQTAEMCIEAVAAHAMLRGSCKQDLLRTTGKPQRMLRSQHTQTGALQSSNGFSKSSRLHRVLHQCPACIAGSACSVATTDRHIDDESGDRKGASKEGRPRRTRRGRQRSLHLAPRTVLLRSALQAKPISAQVWHPRPSALRLVPARWEETGRGRRAAR